MDEIIKALTIIYLVLEIVKILKDIDVKISALHRGRKPSVVSVYHILNEMEKGINIVTTVLLALLVSRVIDINNMTWSDYLILTLFGVDIVLQIVRSARRR